MTDQWPEYDQDGKRVRLSFVYGELPPTANKIYVKGNMLHEDAREYRERFRTYVHQNYGHQLLELPEPNVKETRPEKNRRTKKVEMVMKDVGTKDPNCVFVLYLIFYMDVLNETWGDYKLPPSRRATFRFKKTDLTNRIKFVEDCVKYAVDIDDSLTFESHQAKRHDPENLRVEVHLLRGDPRNYGIPLIGGTM